MTTVGVLVIRWSNIPVVRHIHASKGILIRAADDLVHVREPTAEHLITTAKTICASQHTKFDTNRQQAG